jgi:hypothetical protein
MVIGIRAAKRPVRPVAVSENRINRYAHGIHLYPDRAEYVWLTGISRAAHIGVVVQVPRNARACYDCRPCERVNPGPVEKQNLFECIGALKTIVVIGLAADAIKIIVLDAAGVPATVSVRAFYFIVLIGSLHDHFNPAVIAVTAVIKMVS